MWEIEISNIAGIRNGTTTLQEGANAVQASNWQGKTSLIIAIKTILSGSATSATLTNGADSGYIRLQTPDKEYDCRLERTGGTVQLDGKTYLDKERHQVAAELYAFLDESNTVRTAVREGNDLTPHLIEPLRREDIEGQITELKSKRETVQTELNRAEKAAEKLPSKIEQINSVESKLYELQTELDDLEGDPSDTGGEEELREELKQARRKREQVNQRINRLEGKINSLKSQIEEKEKRLSSLSIPSESNLSEDLSKNRSKLREINQEIETLEALYNATNTVLDGDHLDLLADIDRQIDDDYLSCWVCGTDTTRDTVENRMEEISEMIADRRDRHSELQTTVSDLEERKNDIDQKRREKTQLKENLDRLRTDLADSKDEISTAKSKLEEHTENVENLENKVEETDDRRKSLEKEIAQNEAELESLQDKKDSLEKRAKECDNLEKEVNKISDRIETLRSRRQDVIESARIAFDEALEDVVTKFNPSFEKARLEKYIDESGRITRLELIIVRDGREISVDALSEGEVELIGFIAALAGYEAFDVADQVPCILVDNLGGLASEHIHTLMKYLEKRTNYLVSTAYPEAGEFNANVISPADWDVVSDDIEQPA
jgi:DNA repair exonuclease SbcCD ATPase subunit